MEALKPIMTTASHPDSYNTGNADKPTISYEEYMREKEKENADKKSSDNT